MMNVNLKSPLDLTADQLVRWRALQQIDLLLQNPYFCPEFHQAAAKVRKDVLVAVLGNDEAFFPFQRSWNQARPVGGKMSDYQGLIAPSDFEIDPLELVR